MGPESREAELVGYGSANSLIETNIVVLHHTPVAPLESYPRWSAVHLHHLPRKGGHHALEGFVTGGEIRVLWAVVLVRCNDGIVRSDFEHVLSGLGRATIDGERVVFVIDGPPVFQPRFERGLYFPVLDKILHELWQRASGMVLFLACPNTLAINDLFENSRTLSRVTV